MEKNFSIPFTGVGKQEHLGISPGKDIQYLTLNSEILLNYITHK